MELHKLKPADIRGLEASQLRETELELRRELVKIRMDIYTAKSANASKVVGLKTSLARLLTIANEKGLRKPAAKAAAPKAAKVKAPSPKAQAKAKAKAAAPAKDTAAAKKPAKAKTSKK